MPTIEARVNIRLLSKAGRMFTGTQEGRVIEVLQNARRAGATEVHITNDDGIVTVRDNGRGIEDFTALLDLGGSGWDDALEASEDPAGVGIFCLAPREVTIRSNGKMVTVTEAGWRGTPASVADDPEPVEGTVLRFRDEEWSSSAVDINAVFSGLQVTVDGRQCPSLPFVSDRAVVHAELGCRIEVRKEPDLNPWHHSCKRGRSYHDNVLVNFHGQVLSFDFHPVSERRLHYLVDMTGEATGIRLMLPARTCLVENDALELLKSAMELEAYRYVQRCGEHTLPHDQYLRAGQLGVPLPEAKPTYTVGSLAGDGLPDPAEVVMPEGFPLTNCFRMDLDEEAAHESDEANAHLLAALGKLDVPFIPACIRKEYDGYSWASLPTVTRVEVAAGKELHRDWLWSGTVTCVDSLRITAQTSDGKIFASSVCMAIGQEPSAKQACEDCVLVTPAAEEAVEDSAIWFHLGGWYDDGDTYETQLDQFAEDLDRFWAHVVGPDEHLRRQVLRGLDGIRPAWRSVTISKDGIVTVHHSDGTVRRLEPPSRDTSSADTD